MSLSLIGIILALIAIIVMIVKGINIFIAAIISSIIVAITGGVEIYSALKDSYMAGFVAFFKSYFLVFAVGAIFGKFMEETKAAASIAKWIIDKLGDNAAAISIPLAASLIAYGGVNAFVVIFSVFPIALQVFKRADIPRRFIPGAVYLGVATYAMVAPGTPQIQNIIPTEAMGVPLMSGVVVGFAATAFQCVLGCFLLKWMVKRAKANGEKFIAHPTDVFKEDTDLPSPLLAFVPLIGTLIAINLSFNGAALMPVEYGVGIGVLLSILLMNKNLENSKIMFNIGEGVKSATLMIFSTCAVVGFGSVVKIVPAFELIVNNMLSLGGSPLIGAAVGTTVIAGITGSASGGLGIAAPILAPHFLATDVAAGAIARVMAISSSALDSLPHNGAVVAIIDGVCKETHKSAYMPIFILSVLCPLLTTTLTIIGFMLFPGLP